MILQTGNPAPVFSLPDQTGLIHRLSDYKGKWVLIYFYPKDDTPGCTLQACELRDSWDEFKKRGVIVLGISKDTVNKHKGFSKKYSLPFPLLADERKEVINLYGVLKKKKMFGRQVEGTHRTSFLINPRQIIEKIYPDVDETQHVQMVLSDLNILLKE